MKVSKYISGGNTRCVQAAFRMVVHALTSEDVSAAEADNITGYIEGRGTWQFRMLLGFAHYGLTVVDCENFDAEQFLTAPEEAISSQVGDIQVAQAIIEETDIKAEQAAIISCLDSDKISLIKAVPNFAQLEAFLNDDYLLLVNVNKCVLDGQKGREGYMLIVEAMVEDGLLVHDPGPNGGVGLTLNKNKFIQAWTSPAPEMANIIAVKSLG